MTKPLKEADSAKYNRVLRAMSGAGAIYVGSESAKSQMVVTRGLLGDSPLKPLLDAYLCEGTALAGIMSRDGGGFVLFWHRETDTSALNGALGADTRHLCWDETAGEFAAGAGQWPGDYVFSQFLLLVNLGQIKLPVNAGKVFCPFCGDYHEPSGEEMQCPRLGDDFARFTAALSLH